MTGFSTGKFGLTDRGELRDTALADLVVLDHETIVDKGTFTDPNHYPEGIHHLFDKWRMITLMRRPTPFVHCRTLDPFRQHVVYFH